MDDPIPESQLIQVGATTDAEFVLLAWGDPQGDKYAFEITHGRFEHAMQQLNDLSARLQAQRQAIGGLVLSVPLAVEDAQASASLGGQVVFLDFRAEGSMRKVEYSMTAAQAEDYAKRLLAAAASAKSQADKPRH